MKLQLRQIEIQLQSLIEGNAARLFPGATSGADLINQMVATLQNGARYNPGGRLVNPNLLILEISPDQAYLLNNNQALIDQLTQALYEHTLDQGGFFESPLAIRVIGSAELSSREMNILGYHSQDGLAQTSSIEPESIDRPGTPFQNAYLVVNGTQVFDISRKIVNIGRKEDNDLVIDDPRISRRHAQLRLVGRSYLLSDLDSTGGTQVNGERIHQKVLSPGDVISLAGVPLVFSQEAYNLEDTQKK